MKFAVVAALALTAVSAEVSTTRCNTTTINPWVSTSADPGKTCLESNGFRGSGYASPTEETIQLVCGDAKCRALVDASLDVRPAIGDCFVSQAGVRVNFYETVILPFAEACKTVTPPPAATTTAPPPAPTTTAPPPTTTAPPPTTTAPPPTTTAPPPTTFKPVPTTTRPAC